MMRSEMADRTSPARKRDRVPGGVRAAAVRVAPVLLAVASGIAPCPAAGSEPPAVLEARGLAREIAQAQQAGRLRARERTLPTCPGEDVKRRIWTDARGRVARYEREAGSDDSARRYELLYDPAGRLRFAFIRGGAANGTVLEVRIYFDAAGRRAHEVRKLVSGPGYTFPDPWPDEDLPRDPGRDFASSPACEG